MNLHSIKGACRPGPRGSRGGGTRQWRWQALGQMSPGVPWGPNSPLCTAHVYDWGLNFPPPQTALGPALWPPPAGPVGLHQSSPLVCGTPNLSGSQPNPGLLQGCSLVVLKGVCWEKRPYAPLGTGRPELSLVSGSWEVAGEAASAICSFHGGKASCADAGRGWRSGHWPMASLRLQQPGLLSFWGHKWGTLPIHSNFQKDRTPPSKSQSAQSSFWGPPALVSSQPSSRTRHMASSLPSPCSPTVAAPHRVGSRRCPGADQLQAKRPQAPPVV